MTADVRLRTIFSQVHEIHPSHAFLVVPDKLPRSRSEPHNMMSAYGEACMSFCWQYLYTSLTRFFTKPSNIQG